MNWYRPIADSDKYDGLVCVNREDAVFIANFNRDWYRYRKKNEWKNIFVEIAPEEGVGDFPSFLAQCIVFNEKSWKLLQALIADAIEPLPLISTDGNQYITIKVLDLVDCLDYSQSVYRQSAGGFIQVSSYVFQQEDNIVGKHIFWLPKAYHAVVSEEFKNLVEQNQLKGLIFKQLC
jgi:hypothetical protein